MARGSPARLIGLVEGRTIGAEDRAGSAAVALVSERLAHLLWPGERPLGRRIRLDGKDGPVHEVVGVVRDARFGDLTGETSPMVYVPLAQRHVPAVAVQVRTAGAPSAVAAALRTALRELDPGLPFGEVRPLEEDYCTEAMLPSLLMAKLMGVFGLAALLVAAAGLGGVVAFSAAERTRELAVRLALGAEARHVVWHVVWLVVRQEMRLAAAGMAAGVPVAAAGAVLLSRSVPGVGAADVLVVSATVFTLAMVAAVASWIPARRASRLAPAAVLRAE